MHRVIANILTKERARQKNTIELIASENFASDSVMALCGSEFTNKYAEGYPEKRYYNGCEHMDEIESLAIATLTKLYSANFANVQPHSGANANLAAFLAFLMPYDKILGMDLSAGGHLSHGSKPNISGKFYESYGYGVDENGLLDYNAIYEQALKVKPKMLIAGASAYPRQIDWAKFREIADEVGAILLVDMAHYSGLIAGGAYDSPVPYADVVTSTTHKTLRGPRGGFILWNDEKYTKPINSAIFPGTQGGPLMNIIAAKVQAFIEASEPDFAVYSRKVVSNAQALSETFMSRGMSVLTGGTDSHIVLLNLTDSLYSGREAADMLEESGITVNKNSIPNDKRSFTETSGIRVGTAAETTRGYDEARFVALGNTIADILGY
jgi:glycine hydroxymethyltransferase